MTTTAKENLKEYEETRKNLKEKLKPLFDEKDKKRNAIKEVFNKPEEQEARKKLEKTKRQELNQKFKEENKDLIEKYQTLYKEKKLNENKFQEALKTLQELNPKLTEADVKKLIMGNSVEKIKTPQLEKENHKIDKDLTLEEKLNQGWEREERSMYIDGLEKKVTVIKKKIKGTQKNAFVREYINEPKDVIPNKYLGQQLFTRYAVQNLAEQGKVDLSKLLTYKQMEEIRGGNENHKKFLENNFQKDGEIMLAGYWTPNNKKFYNIGERTGCWLSGGNYIGINEGDMGHDDYDHNYGFSLRFLKN